MDRFQLRRDSLERWESLNPILLEGEIGLVLDTKSFKIGDGIHNWNDLDYSSDPTILQELGDSESAVISQKGVTQNINTFNISKLYPTEGNNGTNKYTLSQAINKLVEKTPNLVVQGTKIEFIDLNSDVAKQYIYIGGISSRETNWYLFDIYGNEIHFANFSISDTGIIANSSLRITSSYLPNDRVKKIRVKDGYMIGVINYFDSNLNFIKGIQFLTQEIYISEKAPFYRFSIGKTNGASITPQDDFGLVIEDVPNDLIIPLKFEFGALNASNGRLSESNIRVRTPLIRLNQGGNLIRMSIPDTLTYNNAVGFKNGFFVGDIDIEVIKNTIVDNGLYVSNGTYDCIMISLTKGGEEITQSELNSCSGYYIKDINDINNQIEAVESTYLINQTVTLEVGNCDQAGGRINSQVYQQTNSFERLLTPKYLRIDGAINPFLYIDCPSTMEYTTWYYDENKKLISPLGEFITSPVNKIPVPVATKFVKIGMRNLNDRSSVPDFYNLNIQYKSIDKEPIFEYNSTLGTYPVNIQGHINICGPVRVSNPQSTIGTTTDVQDQWIRYANYGILKLPTTYNERGKPTPLIIFCHGYSTHYSYNSLEIANTSNLNVDYLLKEGFAVMDIDGNPLSSTIAHGCSNMAIEAYIAGYKWVIDRFNVTKEVYMAGHSEGGMMAALLTNIGDAIPIKGTCLFAPASSIMMLMDLHPEHRDALATYYGMQGTRPTWSTGRLNAEEKQYLYNNIDRMMKSSTLWSSNTDINIDDVKSLTNSFLSAPTDAEKTFYNSKHKLVRKSPIKIFHGTADTSCLIEYSELLYNMLKNSGVYVEFRVLDGVGHTGTNGIVAVGSNRINTAYGEILTGIPTTLIEMVKFFRRFS